MAPNPNDVFLETAFSIGAKLCRNALWDGRRCTWLGPSSELLDGEWKVVLRTYGSELYHGTSGNALFLAHLYRFTGDKVLRAVAEGAACQAISIKEDIPRNLRAGFYTGWAGLAYACVELAEATGEERWIAEGKKLFNDLAKENLNDQGLDVLAGIAGGAAALLSVHQRHGGSNLLDLAVRFGDSLLGQAKKRDQGCSWDTMSGTAQDHLTGFSHGVAGIAWALLEIYHATGEQRFKEAALEGFRYERHWYSPQHENWPDLRDPEIMQTPASPDARGFTLTYPQMWCHGAPGIGLSRLRSWELTGDVCLLAEAEASLRSTIRNLHGTPSVANYSLCHGFAGNSEILIYGSQVLDDPSYLKIAEKIGWDGIRAHKIAGTPWPSGMMGNPEAPNLMLGMAGTGYFYLRLHDPEAIPSVLILPRDGKASASTYR